MKSKHTFMLLLGVGLSIAIFVGYHYLLPKTELTYDDDQEGLGDQIVFKFSHVVAENTPKGLAANKFAELVYEKSNGTIKIEVFPNGSLYSDIEEINALQEGQVHFIAPSTSKLGMLSSEWGVLDLPYAFPNHEAVQEGLNGKIGQQLLNSLQKDGIIGLAHWSNGFKQITSNKGPIYEPEDIKGQSFRIMQSDIIQAQFEKLHVKALQESFNSTYQLLEEGKVVGEENTISNIYSKRFYNVQKHLTMTNHGYLGYAVMMDQKTWDKQSDKTKKIIQQAMAETTEWNNSHAIKMNDDQLKLIKQNSSIEIHELTEAQEQQWKQEMDPVYEELAPKIGEQIVEDLKELRAKYEVEKID
ncbi:TRAP transporter substrate-binding protein [Bacillus sp. CECT 9360]|uniref:TRAP transporter substrate-binding protein n=1 Tax=Bacillus sp. CECT 9360 TaxID=2845821 RepID=UPI001E55E140|nr:TRAP transporter substrate-binding protein [Bacillus sp. CECT 9360]CAH0343970.1 C4-dicarboxylate-binding periplasmic protein DctP [Bacillus sp. CECT 9360]